MNVLLTPYAREEKNPDPILVGLLPYNCTDGFGRGDQLNFSAVSEDEAEYPSAAYLKKGKVSRQDPLSHRIIEKRRRDRMNNCLADLSRLIPPEYLKKGRGRVEKTEIIEMAIRHLKYLQERANAGERRTGDDSFRAGYQEAGVEAVRFLVEVRGYSPSDGLCHQMAEHLQRHVEAKGITKGETLPREKLRVHPNTSSETTSSNSSSQGFSNKSVITQALAAAQPPFQERYDEPYTMECDRVSVSQMQLADNEAESGPLPLDGRRRPEPTLRDVRKPEHNDDFLHSYKFKNSIERRFSRSQDSEITEATDMPRPSHPQNKVYSHKRRRAAKPAPSASTSNSGSTEENRDTSPQDTSSESHHHYGKPPSQLIPVFALNTCGKYYVPLSVEYSCLSRHLSPFSMLEATAATLQAPLHPVTINVNFQPSWDCYMKRERELEWRGQ